MHLFKNNVLSHLTFLEIPVEPTSYHFFTIYLCTLGNGYVIEHIGFKLYFNLKCTGSVLQVPSVPSNNSSNCCNNLIDSLHSYSVK